MEVLDRIVMNRSELKAVDKVGTLSADVPE